MKRLAGYLPRKTCIVKEKLINHKYVYNCNVFSALLIFIQALGCKLQR